MTSNWNYQLNEEFTPEKLVNRVFANIVVEVSFSIIEEK